jgi:hypothetical protein
MVFLLDTRPADSPYVKEIWRVRSERAGSFVSIAVCQWQAVVTRRDDKTMTLTVRGPETVGTPLSYPVHERTGGREGVRC